MKKLTTARALADAGVLPGASEAAWRAKARAGLVPHVRCGRLIYFDPDAIAGWIAAGGTPLSGVSTPSGAAARAEFKAAPQA